MSPSPRLPRGHNVMPCLAPWSPGHAMQLPGNFYVPSFLSSYILIVKFHFEFKSLFSCAIYFRAYIETSFNITKTMLKIMNLTGQKNHLFLHLYNFNQKTFITIVEPLFKFDQKLQLHIATCKEMYLAVNVV